MKSVANHTLAVLPPTTTAWMFFGFVNGLIGVSPGSFRQTSSLAEFRGLHLPRGVCARETQSKDLSSMSNIAKRSIQERFSRLVRKPAASIGAAVRNRSGAPLVHRSARSVSEIRNFPHRTRFAAYNNNINAFWVVVRRDQSVLGQLLPRRVRLYTLLGDRGHHHVNQIRAPKLPGRHLEVF